MKMYSIRIDFSAKGVTVDKTRIPLLISEALALLAGERKFEEPQEAMVMDVMSEACSETSTVQEYDDHREKNNGIPRCRPVFYIP